MASQPRGLREVAAGRQGSATMTVTPATCKDDFRKEGQGVGVHAADLRRLAEG